MQFGETGEIHEIRGGPHVSAKPEELDTSSVVSMA
jgi:hypothetical protein